ncbi:MAG: alanine--glyoxylate aminotransferase family protein [Eubacteriales bacterium]|nr:alanine--glyoxylate aminotransferase family protein [Eubacteriales bacterium]
MYKIMTPGPTQVAENVRLARSRECTNPDLDTDFVEFYKKTCEEISHLLHTENETLILGGEGILGLEAACASMTEPGDRVLVLDNGIYGRGFADFVSMYGGKPELYSRDYRETLDVQELENFLKDHHDYKYATVVHGDTPSGMLNDISAICPLLKKYGIMTVVDSVSASFGEPMRVSDWKIDIMCGGSQKVVSAPPGLTFVVISDDAKKAMAARKTPIASFYANLTAFAHYYEEKWFPYTMPISDIYGLRAAIDNIAADPDILDRHEKIAAAARKAITGAGLKLYLKSGFSSTVTVFEVPAETTADAILDGVKKDYNIMLAGSFDVLAGKVIRIGHMGNNATFYNVREVFAALDGTLARLGVPLKASMEKIFCENMK